VLIDIVSLLTQVEECTGGCVTVMLSGPSQRDLSIRIEKDTTSLQRIVPHVQIERRNEGYGKFISELCRDFKQLEKQQ